MASTIERRLIPLFLVAVNNRCSACNNLSSLAFWDLTQRAALFSALQVCSCAEKNEGRAGETDFWLG